MLCFEIPTDGVMSPGVVVSGVLLAGDHLLGVEELLVGSGPHLVNHTRFQVDEHRAGNMLENCILGRIYQK